MITKIKNIGLVALLVGSGLLGSLENAVAQQSPGEKRFWGNVLGYVGGETAAKSKGPGGRFGGNMIGIAGDAMKYGADVKAQKEIAEAGRSQQNINVNVNTPTQPQYSQPQTRQREELPVNVVRNEDGTCSPADGYIWINTSDNSNLSVRKINDYDIINYSLSNDDNRAWACSGWIDGIEGCPKDGKIQGYELTELEKGTEENPFNVGQPIFIGFKMNNSFSGVGRIRVIDPNGAEKLNLTEQINNGRVMFYKNFIVSERGTYRIETYADDNLYVSLPQEVR